MADHISAKKRAKQNIVRHARNTVHYSKVKTVVRNFRRALREGKTEELANLLQTAQSTLAKAASKGIIHANNAARQTSRLAQAMKNLKSGVTKTAAKAPAKTKASKSAPAKKAAPSKAKKAAPKGKKGKK